MALTIELPSEVEEALRSEPGDVQQAAKEALLVELYRQRRITHGSFCRALGLTRLEADGVLKRHNVIEDLITVEQYNAELAHLESMKLP